MSNPGIPGNPNAPKLLDVPKMCVKLEAYWTSLLDIRDQLNTYGYAEAANMLTEACKLLDDAGDSLYESDNS